MSETAADAAYFGALEAGLTEAGYCQPVLVVDRARLDQNLESLQTCRPGNMAVRIVAKSLPSSPLLRYVMERLDTSRLMTFNLPMLRTIASDMPDADQLLGKPFPVAAAGRFLDDHLGVASNVQWLIDTNERLEQYEALAAARDVVLRISLELDVGLRRGGFVPGEGFRAALHRIERSDHLALAGLMGYEAHVAKVPTAGGLRGKAFDSAMAVYTEAVEIAMDVFGVESMNEAVLNSAGSMTFPLHGDGPANEMSIGTTLLKGTDFDLDLLESFVPAVFIATPALKVLPRTEIPGVEALGRAAARIRRTPTRTIFIHGGHWLADPVYPVGLSTNSLYGRSSNQEMLNLSTDHSIEPDDFVFLRPHQTEAVLLQFGDIAVVENGQVVERWTTFDPSA